MRKMYLLTLLLIIIITVGFILFAEDTDSINKKFLASYGWNVSPHAIEIEYVEIPKKFDSVYSEYNQLQIKAGLDLSPYKGRQATRYTYTLLNYPDKSKDMRANVLSVDDMPVGGDIMCVSLNGLMESLSYSLPESPE